MYDQSLILEQDKILDILPSEEARRRYQNAPVTDYSNFTAMPGMIDCHVHLCFDGGHDPLNTILKERTDSSRLLLRSIENGAKALAVGVTTVRDCGAAGEYIYELRDAINSGRILGARILTSGTPITTTGGHCWFLNGCADSKEEIKKEVRKKVQNGADFIKVMASGGYMTPGSSSDIVQYSDEEMVALCQEAHAHNKKVAAHALSRESILQCIRAGVDTIEHCILRDHAESDTTIFEYIRDHGAVYSPAFTASCFRESARTENAVKRLTSVREMCRAGIKICAGTDAGCADTPFGSYVEMLEFLHEYLHLSQEETLLSATVNAAKCIGMDRLLGKLEPGKIADILILKNDPLESIENLQTLQAVYQNGKSRPLP